MTDNLKYSALILFVLAALPTLLIVHIIIAILEALLTIFKDVSTSLSDPRVSKLYRWMGWV